MNDRELLELAAKAFGIGPVLCYETARNCLRIGNRKSYRLWRPLTENGDAFALSVKHGEPFVVRSRCVTTMGGLQENFNPSIDGDDLRATRRVIVRAAASRGKAMP